MIQSMTGYGSCEKSGIKVEMRSLNHRFLDIQIKAPIPFFKYEIDFRKLLKKHFSRGHILVQITFTPGQSPSLTVNDNYVRNILTVLRKIKDEHGLSGNIEIDTLLSFEGTLITQSDNFIEEYIFEVFTNALESLKEMRKKEGEMLLDDMYRYIDSVDGIINRVTEMTSESTVKLVDEINKRMKDLLGDAEYDKNRILQEAAILAEKSDISEETSRIRCHIEQFRKNLSNNDKIGRKLDFMLQELNREANTLSVKAGEYAISELVVELKSELEKLREQVQNIQ